MNGNQRNREFSDGKGQRTYPSDSVVNEGSFFPNLQRYRGFFFGEVASNLAPAFQKYQQTREIFFVRL